jgi:hypothetical protein
MLFVGRRRETRFESWLRRVQIGYGAHQTLKIICTGGLSQGVKRLGHEANNLYSASKTKDKNYTSARRPRFKEGSTEINTLMQLLCSSLNAIDLSSRFARPSDPESYAGGSVSFC